MCEPTTIALTAMAVSGAMSAYGSYQQGQFSKGVAEYNARVDQNTAKDVLSKARTAESEERQRTAELQSRQRAVLASRGVNIDTGTALKLQEDTALVGEVNALRIRQNADDQASALRQGAELTKAEGKNAARQGTMKGISTLIGTAGSVGMGAYDAGLVGGGKGAVAPKWYAESNKFNLGNQNLIASLGR